MQSILLSLTVAALAASGAHAAGAGVVYTLGNAADGNTVVAYDRDDLGALTFRASYPTGGLGSGGGLGSQNALWLSKNGKQLFAVNAGSDTISAFRIDGATLTLTDVEPSLGIRPISVTQRGSRVYVLDSGGAGNVAGFTLTAQGALVPIPGAVHALSSAAAAPAQVELTPDGELLVVTEKATGSIDLYPVLADGTLGAPHVATSNGMTPFGFGFGKHDALIVAEAFGGATNASAVSSYQLGDDGGLDLVSGSVPTTETAACWIALTKDARFAYTTNAGSGTVTGFRVVPKTAQLQILDADGVTGDLGAGANPIDVAVTQDDRWLYVLSPATGEIAGFRIRKNGALEKVPSTFGLPADAVGLAAR